MQLVNNTWITSTVRAMAVLGLADRTKLLDLHMLVLFGAQERTADEYRALLEADGFDEFTVHPTNTPYSVVEAVRL